MCCGEDEQIKLSIIMPVYNKGMYLRSAIISIIDQCCDSIEIILVDDGSTDNSSYVCDEFSTKFSWIRVLHQSNSGVSAARNRGLLAASGKYILFMDADDLIADSAINEILKTMEHISADICIYNYSVFQDEHFIPGLEARKSEADVIVKNTEDFEALFLDLLESNVISNIGTKIYKRSIIAGLCFIPFNICEDVSFCIDAIMQSERIAYINKPIYIYRQNVSGSLMSGYKQNYFEAACVLIGKFNRLRLHFSNSVDSKKSYIKYTDIVCKKILINESKLSFNSFYRICLAITISEEFAMLFNIACHDNIKNRVFYIILKNKLFLIIYIYYLTYTYIKKRCIHS